MCTGLLGLSLDLFARLALRASSRKRGRLQRRWLVNRMRLSKSSQRSMAHAVHLRAGHALAAASGFR
eukprot:SM000141S00857  [mRNA]  locus=s141:24378:24596:- [translate_table: standard]